MNGSAGLTLSNAGNVTLTGSGLALNSGTLTFNQVSNSTLTAKIAGGGGLAKGGSNTLTVVSADSTSFSGLVTVNGGTLRSGSVNALGSGTVTINSGATWDLNGKSGILLSGVSVSGVGADGQGAINNRGAQQTNAFYNLTFTGDTILGAASNRWDIAPPDTNGTPGNFTGNGYKLTKTGTNDIWVRQLTDTGLGDIDVTAGRLIFAGATTKLGLNSSTITVRSNSVLGFANSVQDSGKSTRIAPGGQLYAANTNNEFDGAIILSNGLVKLEPNAQLRLGGNLSGPAPVILQGTSPGFFGTLTLSGTNTYAGSTLLNEGEVDFASSQSIPAGTNIVLASRVLYNASGHPVIGLLSNVVSPASVRLDMLTFSSNNPAQAFLQGNGGVWAGPIKITGSDVRCVANFTAGQGGLTVAGAVDGSAFIGSSAGGNGGVKIGGDSVLVTNAGVGGIGVRFNNSLQFTGTLQCANTGLGGQPGMSKLVLGSSGNFWTNMFWNRGIIQIGADNALPLCPITVGTLQAGADHRVILDLNGHTQTLTNWVETFLGLDPVWFGNSSTNANATLTYAGTGTNSWTAYIIDAFDTSAAVQMTTALRVNSGYLKLVPFPNGDPTPGSFLSGPPPYPFGMTYTGPTTITGGTLEVDKYLGVSAVTVSGTGMLRGNGSIGGTVNVASGATVAPGTNVVPGTLLVVNNVTFSAGSKASFRVNLTTGTNDELVVQNMLTYGGTLVVTNTGAQPFTNGTVLKLFDASSYVAGPVSIQPAVPATGLVWDASRLAMDGTLRVTTPVATTISGVGRLPDRNVGFTINGPAGQAYTVRASANVATPLASWTVLQSGTLPSANYIFNDLTATNAPTRFYIISTP
jgi:autotransporter-associated beta strand protein